MFFLLIPNFWMVICTIYNRYIIYNIYIYVSYVHENIYNNIYIKYMLYNKSIVLYVTLEHKSSHK